MGSMCLGAGTGGIVFFVMITISIKLYERRHLNR